MSYTVNGGAILTECISLSDDTPTDLMTASGKTLIVALYVAETGGGTPSVTIEKFSGAMSCHLLKDKALQAGELMLLDILINFKTGDILRVTGSPGGSMDVWVSYLAGDKTALGSPGWR
ncbi:hypothetical protein [Devosia sp.]|uniref:hypothetical protein n=1 Tax=Devosia sp. TaxID=1871048 RepID=UPI002AFEE481|nr:hypothetical protein [Devosia sp.]